MDTFEKEMTKKQLEIMKAINRNLNYLGRKLEETNKILQKMVPVPLEEREGPMMFSAEEISEWNKDFFNSASSKFTDDEVKLHFALLNKMIRELEEKRNELQ